MSLSKLVLLGTFLAGPLAYADTVILAKTPAALGANDTVTWGQLGADGTLIPHSFSGTSAGGKTVPGSFSGTTGIVATVGASWGPASGAFVNGGILIWAFDSAANNGTGPVTFTLPAGSAGAGAAIQSDAPGAFTAKVELFNGAISLGSATLASNAAGDAIFIGALDTTGPNATSAVFSLTANQSNGNTGNNVGDFALDKLSLNITPPALPDFLITKTHLGSFTQGQVGAAYTITVNNAGTAGTTGTVTVSDTVPAGLTPAAATGTGWVCNIVAQTVTCTRSDTLAAGGNYPAITLTVAVAANAPATVTNTVTVTGGGVAADADDTANDPTTILGVFPAELTGVYQLRYLANLNQGDSYLNFTNAGTLNGFDPAGRICVNVYTFDPAEELISCCACPITPNGLNSLSARNDLISNTLTPGVPSAITVKLLSSLPLAGNVCNASSPTAANLVRGTRAWATTLHLNTSILPAPGVYQSTETPFSNVELSPSELSKLTSFCGFIQSNGSGFGICKSCQVRSLGGGTEVIRASSIWAIPGRFFFGGGPIS